MVLSVFEHGALKNDENYGAEVEIWNSHRYDEFSFHLNKDFGTKVEMVLQLDW